MSGFYNLRTTPKGWQVTKFDEDFNVESSYEMTQDTELRCGCPAGARPNCRHREMFPFLLPKVNTAWFLDHDTYSWVDPTGEAASAASSSISEHPRAQAQSLEGAFASGAVKIVEDTSEPTTIILPVDSHPFRRRM